MIDIILGIVVKSSVILSLTFLASLIARRQSADLRHWIWTVGLFSALLAPFLGMILPAWHPNVPKIAPVSVQATNPAATGMAVNHALPHVLEIRRGYRPGPQTALTIWIIGAALIAMLLLIEIAKLVRVALRSVPAPHRNWRTLTDEIRNALEVQRSVKLLWNSRSSVLGTWGVFRPRILLPRQSEHWTEERMRTVLAHE